MQLSSLDIHFLLKELKHLENSRVDRVYSKGKDEIYEWLNKNGEVMSNGRICSVLKIVDKFTGQLQEQLHEKDVNLELTSAARRWLMNKGYDKNMGARPMERTINEFIKTPLSFEILFGKLSEGGTVKVTKKNDNLEFEYKQK